MDVVNIAAPTFAFDADDPEGFRSGMLRLGPLVGGSLVGASVYELPPGQAVCPYHYEYGEEEWLIVLEGTPMLRTPEGERRLAAWDVICFPSGPAGAHLLRNDAADGAVRILMFSNHIVPCISADAAPAVLQWRPISVGGRTRRNASNPPVVSGSQAIAARGQHQGAAGAQQGQRQAPEGAQHWQGGGGAVARVDKVRVLDPLRPDSLAGAKLGEHTKVAHSAARRRALDRKASASAADRVCRA